MDTPYVFQAYMPKGTASKTSLPVLGLITIAISPIFPHDICAHNVIPEHNCSSR